MKSIRTIAIILWMAIFIAAAFILGQFLVSKNIFDITDIITGQKEQNKNTDTKVEDEFANELVIDKIGQETVRVGLNIAEEYFSAYYKEYVNYVMANEESYPINQEVAIDDVLASDYVFYAISNTVDRDKYESEEQDNIINISEAKLNAFIDELFAREVHAMYKTDGKYNYDNENKKYSIEKNDEHEEYIQNLKEVENLTSNEIVLTYQCKKASTDENLSVNIKLKVLYKGGRYIITDVQKQNI